MNDRANHSRPHVLSDEQLAELERYAEQDASTLDTVVEDDNANEHQRCYDLVDSLSFPIRSVLLQSTEPPVLPDYEDLCEVGRGGMGMVYRGVHKQTRRTDAIKVIRPDRLTALGGSELRHQFRYEAQLAARVAHEHIVPVYQVGEVNGCPWFSMQYVDGKNLQEQIHERPLAPEKAAKLIEQIARAVDKVHRHGILHGDIKPRNILIETDGERPLITDFGLADVITTTEVPIGIAGTPAYMAPELAEAARRRIPTEEVASVRTIAADIYSLGATLWATLTGRSPGEGRESSPSEIPAELARICRRCMLRDPEERYATAGQLADSLSQWLNRPQWNRFFPKLRLLLLLVVAPALLLAGLLVWWLPRTGASEAWTWAALMSGYPPLFLVFALSQRETPAADRARRELWSIWIGHLAGAFACFISVRVLTHPDAGQAIALFYPVWAGLSSLAFFAKSGNFWSGYRWIGGAWAALSVILSMTPDISPVLFGGAAAITCIVIATGDDALKED